MSRKGADAVSEGLSIALAAARLALKNQILIGTISDDASYDDRRFRDVASGILNELADESESDATRLRSQWRKAWGKHSQSDGTHDYRDRDLRNLRKRRKQAMGVADELRAIANDTDRRKSLVESARAAAWSDVSSNLQHSLEAVSLRASDDPNYAMMRDARMQALALVDLQALESQVRARKRVEKEQGDTTRGS